MHLIKDCPDLRQNIFQRIKKYKIKKENFWEELDSANIKLFKGLLTEGYITGNEYMDSDYVDSSIKLMNELNNNILNGDVLYKDINFFYINNKQNELYQGLLLITLNDKEKAENLQNKLNDYIETIKVILKDMLLIHDDLNQFLSKKEEKNIQLLIEIIKNINSGPLNCYEKNYKDNCEELINKFKSKAEIRS